MARKLFLIKINHAHEVHHTFVYKTVISLTKVEIKSLLGLFYKNTNIIFIQNMSEKNLQQFKDTFTDIGYLDVKNLNVNI